MLSKVVKRHSLADDVAARLRAEIEKGTYQVGQKLPIEPELMRIYGVGRSSIREAVKLLVTAGILQVQQGSGTFVKEASAINEPFAQRLMRSNYVDLDEVRSLLEIKIAQKAAVNRTEADIARIREALLQRSEAAHNGDLQECVNADVRFHIAIAEAAGNEILTDMYKSLAVELKKWFLQVFTDTSEFLKTTPAHEAILKSIIDRDPQAAWTSAQTLHGRFL